MNISTIKAITLPQESPTKLNSNTPTVQYICITGSFKIMDFRRVHFSDEVKVCNDKANNLSKLLKTKQNLEPQQEDYSEQTDVQEEQAY